MARELDQQAMADFSHAALPVADHPPPPGQAPRTPQEYLAAVRAEAESLPSVVRDPSTPVGLNSAFRSFSLGSSFNSKPAPPPALQLSSAWKDDFLDNFKQLRKRISNRRAAREPASAKTAAAAGFPDVKSVDDEEWNTFMLGAMDMETGQLVLPSNPNPERLLALPDDALGDIIGGLVDRINEPRDLTPHLGAWMFSLFALKDSVLTASTAAVFTDALLKLQKVAIACENAREPTAGVSETEAQARVLTTILEVVFSMKTR